MMLPVPLAVAGSTISMVPSIPSSNWPLGVHRNRISFTVCGTRYAPSFPMKTEFGTVFADIFRLCRFPRSIDSVRTTDRYWRDRDRSRYSGFGQEHRSEGSRSHVGAGHPVAARMGGREDATPFSAYEGGPLHLSNNSD